LRENFHLNKLSVTFTFRTSPAGEPAIYAPDPLTMRTGFFGGRDKNSSCFVAVEAP
jgi:hypothetical protein